MLRFLRAILSSLFGRRHRFPAANVNAMDDLSSAPGGNDGLRERVVHVMGDAASQDGTVWDERKYFTVAPDGETVKIALRHVRRCDCGRIVGYDKDSNFAGVCAISGNYLCTRCIEMCDFSGEAISRRYAHRIGGRTYCPRHLIYGLARAFLGL